MTKAETVGIKAPRMKLIWVTILGSSLVLSPTFGDDDNSSATTERFAGGHGSSGGHSGSGSHASPKASPASRGRPSSGTAPAGSGSTTGHAPLVFPIVFVPHNGHGRWRNANLHAMGQIKVKNDGAYAAKGYVKCTLNDEEYKDSTDVFLRGSTKSLFIPQDCKDIEVYVKKYEFFWVKKIIFTDKLEKPVEKCYKVWGTTLNSHHKEVDCAHM